MKKVFILLVSLFAMITASSGLKAQEVSIMLHPEWNWIGYPFPEFVDLGTAFGDFEPMPGDVIESYYDYSEYVEGYGWFGGVDELHPGWGYMYYSSRTEDVEFFVFGGGANDPSALPQEALSGEFTVASNGTKVRFSPGNLQCRIDPNKESQITMGTGTTTTTTGYMPYNTYYNYSLCQMIYKAVELRAAGLKAGPVTGIAFESYSTNHFLRTGINIWISATTMSTAPSTSVSTSEMTRVFNGSVTQQTGWTEIDFASSPFTWDGTSNLMVTVVMNHGSWNSTTSWQCSNPGFTCSNYKYTDGSAYDPDSTIYSMNTSTSRPNTRFTGRGGVVWRFAEHQTDCIGASNTNISDTYTGLIDLFGWGTSGHPHGAVCFQPWSTSTTDADYYAYGDASNNLFDQTGEADWGCNPISNGGDEPNQWRMLTKEEWSYVLYTRTTSSGKRYAKARVDGMNGIILLPDNWSTSYYTLNSTNSGSANYTSNTITASQWSTLEQHGAVFLPTAGARYNGTTVDAPGSYGDYWSSTVYDESYCYGLFFNGNSINLRNTQYRNWALSVRLVCQSNPRIRTLGMTNVTRNSATANAEVNYTGSTTVTERGVCFGDDVAPTVNNSFQSAGTGMGAFTAQLTNLSEGTTYHVRAYAKIGSTYIYGNELTFTTARQPSVNTAEVNTITATSALCGGMVSECGQNVTAKGLCWGTSSGPTIGGNHSYDGTGTGSFTGIMTNLSPSTTYYVRAYATTAAGTVYGNQRSFTTQAYHAYVNLGLPSGLLWATCNVGASTPEEYGDYFAWGETTPKDIYSWGTYQYGTSVSMTKYTGSDGLTTLLPEDDAATVNWGNGWRMPTKQNFQELFNNTTVTRTQQNGVNGLLFTAANGNSLFLPAAGDRWNDEFENALIWGLYWSSSLNTSNTSEACDLYFNLDYNGVSNNGRFYGQSVRPVREN